jgi:hypothetical protein
MSRTLASQVLFYLIKRSATWVNDGGATAAGVIWLNGTQIAISDSSKAEIIQGVLNNAIGDAGIIASIADDPEDLGRGILVTDVAHGLNVGDSITINGCTDAAYNGVFTVLTVPSVDTFTVTADYTATDTGYWSLGTEGAVTVTLAAETFTIVFNTGRYYNMRVFIDGTETDVTDTTTPTMDLKIATQTNLGLDRVVDMADATNKDSDGDNEQEPVSKGLKATLENIYSTTDDNYQYLVDASMGLVDLLAYLALASGNFWCRVSVDSIGESAPVKDLVKATISWQSNGGYTLIT